MRGVAIPSIVDDAGVLFQQSLGFLVQQMGYLMDLVFTAAAVALKADPAAHS
jgi:hypothetical protein